MAAASPLALAALAFPDFPSGLCSPAAGNARGEVSPLPAAFDDDLAWATTPKGLVSPKGGFPQSVRCPLVRLPAAATARARARPRRRPARRVPVHPMS